MLPGQYAGHQGSTQPDHFQETPERAALGHANSPSRQLSAPHENIESNVTESGHLSFDDASQQSQAGSNHQQSSSAQEQEGNAPEYSILSRRPAAGSKVATDSVRLDSSYPRVAGSAAVPPRSPFCSDDSAPPTPRIRAAPPKAAQAARSSPAAKADGKGAAQQATAPRGTEDHATAALTNLTTSSPPVPSSAFQETAKASDSPDKANPQQEPNAVAATANEPREAASLASVSETGKQAVDASAATEAQAEASPESAVAPQMPAWLMAELRSPSRRQLQVWRDA